jgi:hypothetical protein
MVTSIAENSETVLRVENEAVQPRSSSEGNYRCNRRIRWHNHVCRATDLGIRRLGYCECREPPWINPLDFFPYPLLSAITSLEGVLIAAFILISPGSSRFAGEPSHRALSDTDHSDA